MAWDRAETRFVAVRGEVVAVGARAVRLRLQWVEEGEAADQELWIPFSQLEAGDEDFARGDTVDVAVSRWLLEQEAVL